jgi:hypothetical protein
MMRRALLIAVALLWLFSAEQSNSRAQQVISPFNTPQATIGSLNNYISVDGVSYSTFAQAWAYAASQLTSSHQSQVIWLGPGYYSLGTGSAASFTIPNAPNSGGGCISVIGAAAASSSAGAGSVATVIDGSSLTGSAATALFLLSNSGASYESQGCTFRNLDLKLGGHFVNGINLGWVGSSNIQDVTVEDSSGGPGIILGTTSGSQQSIGAQWHNVTVSWTASSWTPATRGVYGVELTANAVDGSYEDVTVRNARTGGVLNLGSGNHFFRLHGFGFPYSCTAPPCNNDDSSSSDAAASFATSYVFLDEGSGGNEYTDTYFDSPAIAGFYASQNGIGVNGGHIQWPDTVSFPNANLARIQSTFTANLVIANIGCVGMSPTSGDPSSPAGTGVWITYYASFGLPPTYSSVKGLAGCGQFWQDRESQRQTVWDVTTNNESNLQSTTAKNVVFPLSDASNEISTDEYCFPSALGDVHVSGITGQYSSFAVGCDGTIHNTGGLQTGTVAITSTTSLTKVNHNVLADASGGAFTITLPSCFTVMPDGLKPTGMEMVIYKTDSSGSAITLATTSSQTITYAGTTASTLSIASAGARTLVCGPDSNWYAR